MNIELRRIRFNPDTIDGQIRIDGKKVCDCAENARHCLPQGTYPIIVTRCKLYAKKIPKILAAEDSCESCQKLSFVSSNTNLPCYCPQLCPGNGAGNRTDGAILVGKHLVPGCLIHPRRAFDTLYDRIRKSASRGNVITLTITR